MAQPSKTTKLRREPWLDLQWSKLDKPKTVKSASGSSARRTHVLRMLNPDVSSKHIYGNIASLYEIKKPSGLVYAWRCEPDATAVTILNAKKVEAIEGATGTDECDMTAMIECAANIFR